MAIDTNEFVDKLTKKFHFDYENKNGHYCYVLRNNGKLIAFTYVSRGSKRKEICNTLLTPIARQLKVNSIAYLKEMINCTKSEKDYLDHLRDNGYLD